MSTISKVLGNPPTNFSTTLSAGISSSDLTIPLNSVSGLATEGVGVIYEKDTDGDPVASSIEFIHWTGISGNSLTLSDTGDRGVSGSASGAQAHSSGDTFEVWVHPSYYFRDAMTVEHGTDGKHSANIGLTTPKITTSINDSNGNEIIKTPATASAVNEVTITNAATGDDVEISATGGDTNIHLALSGKGNGLVKVSVLRQDDTTNSYTNNNVILTGWGFKTGDGTNFYITETVTFGITFSSPPIGVQSVAGYKDGSDPANSSDFTQWNNLLATPGGWQTTGFTAGLSERAGGTLGVTRRVGYMWIAIGQLT